MFAQEKKRLVPILIRRRKRFVVGVAKSTFVAKTSGEDTLGGENRRIRFGDKDGDQIPPSVHQ